MHGTHVNAHNHVSRLYALSCLTFLALPSVGVKEGLGWVFSAPQWHGKSRNLALPWLQHSVYAKIFTATKIPRWPKKFVLGCVIPALPTGASSRNLGQTFLANSVSSYHDIIIILKHFSPSFFAWRQTPCRLRWLRETAVQQGCPSYSIT